MGGSDNEYSKGAVQLKHCNFKLSHNYYTVPINNKQEQIIEKYILILKATNIGIRKGREYSKSPRFFSLMEAFFN